jgi:hypothetical protein
MNEEDLTKIRRDFEETDITFSKIVIDFWHYDIRNE